MDLKKYSVRLELDEYSVPTLKGLSNFLNQVVSLGMSFLPFILSPSFFRNGAILPLGVP